MSETLYFQAYGTAHKSGVTVIPRGVSFSHHGLCVSTSSLKSSVALHGINPEAPHWTPDWPVPESGNVRLSRGADGFSIGCSLEVRHRAGLSYRSLPLFSQPPSQLRFHLCFKHRESGAQGGPVTGQLWHGWSPAWATVLRAGTAMVPGNPSLAGHSSLSQKPPGLTPCCPPAPSPPGAGTLFSMEPGSLSPPHSSSPSLVPPSSLCNSNLPSVL